MVKFSFITVNMSPMNSINQKISFNEDFTAENATKIKVELARIIEEGCRNLELDMKNVMTADVVGVNTLALTYEKLLHNEGTMTIKLSAGGQLAKILHLTKFSKILTLIYE